MTAFLTRPFRLRTARELAVLLLGGLTAIVGFTVQVAGLSAGLSLLITFVGIPILLALAVVDRWLCGIERWRAASSSGGTALDPEVVRQLVARRGPLDMLTPREREVLELMAEGRSNAGIAGALVVTESAVEKHLRQIFAKLRLAPAEGDHRRVLAVVAYLRSTA